MGLYYLWLVGSLTYSRFPFPAQIWHFWYFCRKLTSRVLSGLKTPNSSLGRGNLRWRSKSKFRSRFRKVDLDLELIFPNFSSSLMISSLYLIWIPSRTLCKIQYFKPTLYERQWVTKVKFFTPWYYNFPFSVMKTGEICCRNLFINKLVFVYIFFAKQSWTTFFWKVTESHRIFAWTEIKWISRSSWITET